MMNQENNQISMLHFKLAVSSHYLQPQFLQKATYINGLWTDEEEQVPKFVEKFAAFWSATDYKAFCRQVVIWSADHEEEGKEELWYRIRALIMRDKQASLLGIVKAFISKNNETLFTRQKNIQRLCDEISEEDDVVVVNDKTFNNYDSFERLQKLSFAMCQHTHFLLYEPLQYHASYKVSASEQATKVLSKEGV